jgi:hypothetical protein
VVDHEPATNRRKNFLSKIASRVKLGLQGDHTRSGSVNAAASLLLLVNSHDSAALVETSGQQGYRQSQWLVLAHHR